MDLAIGGELRMEGEAIDVVAVGVEGLEVDGEMGGLGGGVSGKAPDRAGIIGDESLTQSGGGDPGGHVFQGDFSKD